MAFTIETGSACAHVTDVTGFAEMLPSIVPSHGLVVVGDGPGRRIRVATDEATPPSLPSGIGGNPWKC